MKSIAEMSSLELAAYYFRKSERTLDQALWIAEKNEFDMNNIEEWSNREGMSEKFSEFKSQYFKILETKISVFLPNDPNAIIPS